VKLYLHVPFCRSRCIYCDFFVVLQKHGGQEAYIEALLQEINGRFATLPKPQTVTDSAIETLYVGGGTPSLLSAEEYQRVFAALKQQRSFAAKAEITLEANPGGAGSGMVSAPQAYLAVGFNRISVGIQSLNDAELKKLSRTHSATEAEAFVRSLQAAGWRNISLDLMYGLPLQTMASWQETLQRAVALDVQHISMYGLKVEEGTPLERLSQLPGDSGGYATPDDDVSVAMYFEGIKILKTAGFERYEISNWAKPGFQSQHNLNYWNQGDWLALGPSAHGYMGGERIENVRNLTAYLNNPLQEDDRVPCPESEQLENALIFGLRKAEGVHIPSLEQRFGIDFRQKYADVLRRFEGDYLRWGIGERAEWLSIPERSIPLAHTVLAEFLL
jgi:oxygen-independent coproporphyrinogen-3 oxidase